MNPILLALALAAEGPVLTLEQALENAEGHQPQLRQAEANTAAGAARVGEVRAPMLPQISLNASWFGSKNNYYSSSSASGSIATGSNGAVTGSSGPFSVGLTGNMLVWDFYQSLGRLRASESTGDSLKATEAETRITVRQGVRSAFFNARAQKALAKVAKDTLDNEDRHLQQVEGFVRAGTHPEIDLVQEKSTRATALFQQIQAQSNYEVSKALLNQAMGIEGPSDYEVAESSLPAIDGENRTVDELLPDALKTRPAYQAADATVRAQNFTLAAVKGGYWPTLSLTGNAIETGNVNHSAYSIYGAAVLTWPIFQGLLTVSQVQEQRANLTGVEAARDQLRQQIRLDVQQALLSVRASLTGLGSAQEAQLNAKERLRLAEGRYAAGVGSIIELGDAQVAETNAAAQLVQAEFNLNNSRTTLMAKLGQP
jgi:outer membrane protein